MYYEEYVRVRALIKRKSNFPHIRKFRVEQLLSHIYVRKGFLIYEETPNISPFMKRLLVIYDDATAPF